VADHRVTPDAAYEKQWAMTVLDRALRHLQDEWTADNRQTHFEVLKPWLTGNATQSQAAAAESLGIAENAVKVAVHRLRRQFREMVIAEISHTVADPDEQQAELADLIAALGH
jgi:RNA polymerase sigma-70 factor (ECF subfamily)